MVKSRFTNLVCILVTVMMIVVTVGFMFGETLGLQTVIADSAADEKGIFSDRDLDGTWDEDSAVQIDISDSSQTGGEGYYWLDGDLWIVTKGVYVLSGTLEADHQIIVEAGSAKVQLILDGITVENSTKAPIWVKKADKVFLTLPEGSENTVSLSGTLDEAQTREEVNAAVYSRSDLTINGSGSLTVTSADYNGIRSSDDLIVTGGTITVDAGENGLVGHDSVRICGGTFNVTAGKDGIKANNDTDEEKGYVVLAGGTFNITADCDGIQAETALTVSDGEFVITTGGGSSEAEMKTEEFGQMGQMGQMPGGQMTAPGENGEMPAPGEDGEMPVPGENGEMPVPGENGEMPAPAESSGESAADEEMTEVSEETAETTTEETETSDSAKALKAGGAIVITGGSFTIDACDDAIHSNSSVQIDGGTLTLAAGDDGIHADGTVTIDSGEVTITGSYEGIEGAAIIVNDGVIDVTSSDDGFNASNGTSSMNFGGMGNAAGMMQKFQDMSERGAGRHSRGGSGMGPGQAQGSETAETAQTAEGSETTESAQTVQGSEPAEPDQAEQGAPEGRPMEMMQPVGTTQEAGTESADGEETVFELSLLEINGGTIHVNAGGDGLDSNGDLIINGGTITVDGPENGGNGALDSGTESGGRLLVNGGTIAAAGSSGMAESFDEASEQASFHCTFSSSFAAGDVLTVTDAEGEEIFSMTMEKSGNDLVFSSPELTAGETVTVTVGEQSMEAVCA